MEDTTTRLQGHVQPGACCCGGCGCTPTGGEMTPRRGSIPERRCDTSQVNVPACRYSRIHGRSRRTWSRVAAWSVLLLTLLNTVTRTTQQSTLAPVTVTAPPGCFQTFKANTTSDIFRGSCAEVTFPCTQLSKMQTVNPTGDCSRYFQCADRVIFDCPCGPGTKFNATVGSCVDSFYASCSCPDGRGPATPTPKPLAGGNTALIAGVTVGGGVISILSVVIVLLMKRRQAQQARPMTPTLGPQYSVKSMNYEDITDLKRGEDPNIYDNGPTFDTALYDNHGFADKEAIRARVENATMKSTMSTVSALPPPLPAGHPSMKTMTHGIGDEDEEPEYMETLE